MQAVNVTCTHRPTGGGGVVPSSHGATPSFAETEVSEEDSHPSDDSAGTKVCSEYWLLILVYVDYCTYIMV